jgi:dUTP pyrophosphatase
MKKLKLKLLSPHAAVPERATGGSVGYDIRACIQDPVSIEPGGIEILPSGFAVALEEGFAAFIHARSGLGAKHGIALANGVGVIDTDYRGEVCVALQNRSGKTYTVHPGDRIAQMVICRCETPEIDLCEDLDATERGSSGFGSSGL